MTDGDSVTINTLCDSAKGTFVTLDDYLPLTGYEPNAMELTNATELRRGLQRLHRLPGFPRLHSSFVRPLHG